MKRLIFICLVLISCKNYNDEIIKAVVYKTENVYWGTTGKTSLPVYKQEVSINYLVNDSFYHTKFVSNDNLGIFRIGDTVLIKTTDNPKEIKVLSEK